MGERNLCKKIGVLLFLMGTVGLLFQQWYQEQQRMIFLQQMSHSLLRLRQLAVQRKLPVVAALHMEMESAVGVLSDYYGSVCEKLQCHEKKALDEVFMGEITPEIRKVTKEEERRLYVQALASLFSASIPGEEKEFFLYYDPFIRGIEQEQKTKKERTKVTACTTGMGLMMLLLLLV